MSTNDRFSSANISEELDNLFNKKENEPGNFSSPGEFLDQVKKHVKDSMQKKPGKELNTVITVLTDHSREINTHLRFQDVGTVQQIGNGVATVSELPNVSIDEIVTFPTGVEGMALNLEKKRVDLIMLGSEDGIRGGDLVQSTGARLKVPVGAQLLGRIIDPLGNPIDTEEPIEASEFRFFSRIAPEVIKRSPVNEIIIHRNKSH